MTLLQLRDGLNPVSADVRRGVESDDPAALANLGLLVQEEREPPSTGSRERR
jgi:hypothetical protein